MAMYDYAHFNELLMGHKSFIVCPIDSIGVRSEEKAIQKFKNRFEVYFYKDKTDLENYLFSANVQLFYSLRAGHYDDLLPNGIKTAIHAVFQYYEPHGNQYAYISDWLSEKMSKGKVPVVPHMINLPSIESDLRKKLGIPENAVVFGRYGGNSTFDIEFVKQVVYQIAELHSDIYFLFMNTDNFLGLSKSYYKRKIFRWLQPILFPKKEFKNMIFLEGTEDLELKRKFINTCDAMLHARWQGETFGLAIGEFSFCNKPIITCNHFRVKEMAHLDILGNLAIKYSNSAELKEILTNFEFYKSGRANWDAYSDRFAPEKVMKKFDEVFIKSNHSLTDGI